MSEYRYEHPFVEIDTFRDRDEKLYSGIKLSPDQNISYMKYTSPENMTVQEHFHDWIEFIYVVDGKIRYTLGEKEFTISSGGLLMNDYNVIHKYTVLKKSEIVFFQIKHGYMEQFSSLFNSSEISCNFSDPVFSEEKRKNITGLFSSLVDFFLGSGELDELGFKSHLMLFIYHLIKDFSKGEEHLSAKNLGYNAEYIGLLLDYLHKHYQENVTLNILSEEFHLSGVYISRLFKENLRIGFKDYLNQIRLNNAVYLLLNTEKSLLDISGECGFPNNKSFIESFKQIYGETPSQYRRNSTKKLKK